MWHKLNVNKPQINIRLVNEKATMYVIPDNGTTIVAIENHMVGIQVQIGKNTSDDVFLDGGSRVNINTK